MNVFCDDQILEGCPIIVTVKVDTFKVQLVASEKIAPLNQPVEICVRLVFFA